MLMHRAWENILHFCEKALNKETGGILIGYYTEDLTTAVITEVTPAPPDSRSGCSWFYRGIAGLKQLFLRKWKEVERRHYLGEWHYHPRKHVEPSIDDMSQMVNISKDGHYNCQEPVMLIVGYGYGVDRHIRALVFPRREPMLELSINSDTKHGKE